MTRAQIIYLHVTLALTALTGTVFAGMKYFMRNDDFYAAANHPWQPYILSAHVLVSPLLLFGLGWVFGNHIWPKFRFGNGPRRRTGISSMWMIVPMTLSGYLIQVATSDSIRYAMAVSHWVSSGIFASAYVAHLLMKRT